MTQGAWPRVGTTRRLQFLVLALAATFAALGPAADAIEVAPPEPVPGNLDPVLRWPDPVNPTGLGSEELYYVAVRGDGRSLLPIPTVERPLRVWVGGDSLSGGAAFGFERLVLGDPNFVVTEEVRLSTGVVSDWYFDWVDHLSSTVGDGGYDVIVLSMGGNDAQRFRGTADLVGSDEWQRRYRDRVEAMFAAVDRPGRLVVWVSMPAVSIPLLRDLPAVVNPLIREVVDGHPRRWYLDAGAIVSPEGVFVRRLEVDDRLVLVREGDGIHYTRDGGQLLIAALLEEVAARSG